MAGNLPPAEADSITASKPVQELIINGDELPERYICKDNYHGATDGRLPLTEIPIIDLSLLTYSSSIGQQEFYKLQSALSSWGCFQAVNHGIPCSFLDKVRESTKQFFAIPMEEKCKYSRATDDVEGYGNDMVLSEHQTLDWTDRVYLLVNPEDQRKLKYWPETLREILHEYSTKLRLLTELLLKAMARSLNLEENSFLKQYGERPTVHARFNFFPRCPRPDLVLGLKPHADGSAITILLQDKEVEGLQVLKDDQWFKVPTIPHALLVNVGDQLEIMSNGIYKSPVHRASINSERERISVAMFCSPDPESEIEPVGKLVNDNRPLLYKKMKNYVASYFQYYQQYKRPIDAVKI